jgi:phosphoribosylaminoimidazole-succinocarboxamide synthase
MSASDPVLSSSLPLPLLHRGKVRDVYEVGSDALLMIASDRVSAFDVVMPQPIPRKGEVLTQITAWWLAQLEEEMDHHLLSVHPETIEGVIPELADSRDHWAGRAMLVRRTEPVLVECVIRGYISGSAWREYRDHGTLAGEPLPEGLRESARLDRPIFSPATKAQEGHDENITFDQVKALVGDGLAEELRDRAMRIYEFGAEVAARSGIILADTKFEFGMDPTGRLLLIDEVMTPDSSRFWPKDSYEVGRGQPSLDKQPIRDWLDALPDWDKQPPGPDLSPEVVKAATNRYLEIFRRLTGTELSDYRAPDFAEDV